MTPESFIAKLEKDFNDEKQFIELIRPMDSDDKEKLAEIMNLLLAYPGSASLLQSAMDRGITDMGETLKFLRTNLQGGAELESPQQAESAMKGLSKILSPEQMARALHRAVGQYSNEDGPSHVQVYSPLSDRSITLEMEILRSCSVQQIQRLLGPLFQAGEES